MDCKYFYPRRKKDFYIINNPRRKKVFVRAEKKFIPRRKQNLFHFWSYFFKAYLILIVILFNSFLYWFVFGKFFENCLFLILLMEIDHES